MRISTLLTTVLTALALSTTLGCTSDEPESGQATIERAATHSPDATHTDSGAESHAAGSTSAPDSPVGATSAADAAPLRIDSSYSTRTTDCSGRDVLIEGQANTIELTGACGTVSLAGRFDTVHMETAETIKITGNSSTVIAKTIGSIRLDGAWFVTVRWVNSTGGREPTVSGDGRAYTVNKISRQEYDNWTRPETTRAHTG